jgi:hypothetical protein
MSTIATPLRYEPALEKQEENEAETIATLNETLHKIQETVSKHSGHAERAVHAKSHGILRGELYIPGNLQPVLAQGLFARPGFYPVIWRCSTVPGDILDDNVSTPRGIAIKIVGVEGPRLPGSESDTTQDLLFVNGPAFGAADAKAFAKNLKLVAATTDKAPGLKKVLSALLRGAEKVVESFGSESPTLLSLGGQPETHPLGDTYYSQVPLLYGAYMVKVALFPASSEIMALAKAPVDLKGKPDGLREAFNKFFRTTGAEWELRVQFCTDLQAMPIEDASTVWPQDKSPFITVGRISVPPQIAWSPERSAAVDDGLSFSPWHGLAAHRPLGSIMRIRKTAYEMTARFRAQRNGRVIEEPHNLDRFPA